MLRARLCRRCDRNREKVMELFRHDKLFIGGEWVTPIDGESVESIDPSTGKPWALVPFGGKSDVDRAVAAANEALRGPWGRMSVYDRAALLRRSSTAVPLGCRPTRRRCVSPMTSAPFPRAR